MYFHVFYCKGDKEFVVRLSHEHINYGYYGLDELPQPFDEKITKVFDKLFEASPTGNIRGVKGATGFIKPEEWEAKKKSLKKSMISFQMEILTCKA